MISNVACNECLVDMLLLKNRVTELEKIVAKMLNIQDKQTEVIMKISEAIKKMNGL